MKKPFIACIIAIFMVLIIASCESPVTNTDNTDTTVQEKTATVVINAPGIAPALRSVMAASNLPLQERIELIESYPITIIDQDGNIEFDETVNKDGFPLEIQNLSIGETIFKVTALDGNNEMQAKGTATKTLMAGKNNIPISLNWIQKEDEAEVILDITFEDPNPISEDKVWIDIEGSGLKKTIEFDSLETAFDYIAENAENNGNYTVRIGGNRNIKNRKLYYDDKTVKITLISNDSAEKRIRIGEWGGTLIEVGKGVTLTLEKGVTIVDPISQVYFECRAFIVKEKFIMKVGSSIVKENDKGWGWVAVIVESTGNFVMDDGAIIGNKNGCTGILASGNFTMNNGTISGCFGSIDDWGSGVFVNSGGIFTMNGGSITNNVAYEGGGVCVFNNGKFIMNNGIISDNTSGKGGGVFVYGNGYFTLNNGTIYNNTSSFLMGGGVYVDWGPTTFLMNGGKIYDNNGTGIFLFCSNFNKLGGTVSDNTDYAIYAKSSVADQIAYMNKIARPEVKLTFTDTESPFASGQWDYVSLASCSVTFDATGGNWEGNTANKDITVGLKTKITPPVNPKHPIRDFLGWYTQQSGGTEFDFSTQITTETTLYARWRFHLPLTHVDEILPYLITYGHDENQDPMGFPLPVKIDLEYLDAESDWWKILESIFHAGVDVNLDLSACTMNGIDFNPISYPNELFYRPGYVISDYYDTASYVYHSGAWYHLTGIILPDIVESYSPRWYQCGWIGGNGPMLKSFSAKNLKTIPSFGFAKHLYADCSSIEYLNIPSVTSIEQYAFQNCGNLKTVILGPVPPTLESLSSFHNTHSDLEIKVPAASVDTYKEADAWRLIKEKIVGM